MKIAHILAAASLIAGIGISTTASAQDYRGDRGRYDHRYDDRRGDHRDWRGDRRGGDRYYGRDRYYGGDRYHGRHGYNNRGRHCRTDWRNHRRVQICR